MNSEEPAFLPKCICFDRAGYSRPAQFTIRFSNAKYAQQYARAAGDAIQDILARNFDSILGNLVAEYSIDFARRAMADLAFRDVDGNYYVVDVKSHRTSTRFNMPKLTSVERLTRFYEDVKNYFVLLMDKYDLLGPSAVFS